MALDLTRATPDARHGLADHDQLAARFAASRAQSEALAAHFSAEDWMLQSMEAASPIKWNLAHTSWFYETFILEPFAPGYERFDETFGYLFNSYYNQVGAMHARARRGVISRPSGSSVLAYRDHVTTAMIRLFTTADEALRARIAPLLAVGIAHEEQHQELLLTDIQHALYQNPLRPAIYDADYDNERVAPAKGGVSGEARAPGWSPFDPGLVTIGHDPRADPSAFAFDNEGPRHQVMLRPFALADRLVTNREFLAFIDDGGYRDPRWWLSDGWSLARAEDWRAPLYWHDVAGDWHTYSLRGSRPVDPHAPVCHISYYEAAAYAEWTGFRLPGEAEWEIAALACLDADGDIAGNVLTGDRIGRPMPAPPRTDGLPSQMFGDVWEWTASPYVAYPGYRTPPGAIGEYNGKFMSAQMVLRGGSCATPAGHVRATYRNFFPADARWQFSGLRLARDL